MNIETKKAVIYCRVSTKEQVDEGNSLITQEKICKEYALKNGYDVAQIFIEQGESAKTANRTELQRLLNYCADKKNQINFVIAYKIDRISRNTDDYSQIRILLKRYNIQIKSTSESFENSTPAGRFMENIIANVAQFDNDVRTERCIGGMREAMREGRYVWKAPYGYTNSKVAGKSSIVPNENAAVILKAFEMVAENQLNTETIRKELFGYTGINSKRWKISRTHFYRILRNKVYAGWIVKFGEQHKGRFEAIIPDTLFQCVQYILDRKKNNTKCYAVNNPDFPLRRFVSHPNGSKLTGSWSQGKRKKYPYYRYMSDGISYSKDILERKFAAFLNSYRLSDEDYMLLKEKALEQLGKQTTNGKKQQDIITKRLEELQTVQTNLLQKNYKGIVSDMVLKTQLELLEKETAKLQLTLYQLPQLDVDFNEIIPLLKEYLKNPGNIWIKSPFDFKLVLQRFEFPSGVEFDGEKFRTPEIANVFKVKKHFFNQKSRMVDLRVKNKNTTDITNSPVDTNNNPDVKNQEIYLDSVGQELKELYIAVKNSSCDSPSNEYPELLS